ncbi:MAG: DUF5652 family protein [bacterium]|nr:DUF5652 family protein [bacterium]
MQNFTVLQTVLLLLVIVWSLLWKGVSLWKAAKNNQRYWFIALLVVNSLGILEVLYLAFWQRKK